MFGLELLFPEEEEQGKATQECDIPYNMYCTESIDCKEPVFSHTYWDLQKTY